MSAIEKFKEYFGMSPVAAYEDEYLDEYERPVHHDIRGRDELYRDEPAPRPRRHRDELDVVDDYSDRPYRRERVAVEFDDEPAPRPRRYSAAESSVSRGPALSTRGAVALAPEEDFVEDGLVTTPETVVERPRNFGDGKGLGENFRAGRAVVLDLSSMARDDARRMVDFAAGLVFGLDGQMQKVADRERTFLLQPAGMDLTEAEVREAVNGAFRG